MSQKVRAKRVCKKCGKEKLLTKFPWAQRTNKDGSKSKYRLRHCNVCERKKRKEWRERNKEKRLKYEREWRRQNPKKAKAHDRRYNHSEKGRAARAKYGKTEKGKAAHRRYRQKLRRLTANLPIEIVRPFVLHMLRATDAERVNSGEFGELGRRDGVPILADLTGISKNIIRDIAYKPRLRSVTVETADKLAIRGEFTLQELYDRAEEWALLTGSKWPEGYFPNERRAPRGKKRKPGHTKQQILERLAHKDYNLEEMAAAIGLKSVSGTSKPMNVLIKEGKVERYRVPGELKKRYRLVS